MRLTPLKMHGGKYYLAPKLAEIAESVPHVTWVETHAGGLAVTFAKNPENVSEIVNDLDHTLSTFWAMLQHHATFQRLLLNVEATPFSELEFDRCLEILNTGSDDPVILSSAFFVVARQSLAGRMKTFTPATVRRTRRGMNAEASAWLSAIEGLPLVHARLKRVMILNRDALDVIRQHDSPDTLFYCDPPYLPETREAKRVYAHEMTYEQHQQLLDTLAEIQGKFMLSGYQNPFYQITADTCGWRRRDFDLPNNAASGKTKRRMIECLWTNF